MELWRGGRKGNLGEGFDEDQGCGGLLARCFGGRAGRWRMASWSFLWFGGFGLVGFCCLVAGYMRFLRAYHMWSVLPGLMNSSS